MDLKLFVLAAAPTLSNLLYRLELKPGELDNSKAKIIEVLERLEEAFQKLQAKGPVKAERGYIEEADVRMQIAYCWYYLGNGDKLQQLFEKSQKRFKEAQAMTLDSFDLKRMGNFRDVIFERLAILEVEQDGTQPQTILNQVKEFVGELDINMDELSKTLWIAHAKRQKKLGMQETEFWPVLKQQVLNNGGKIYIRTLKELADDGFLAKENLAGLIEDFSERVELDDDMWGYDFLAALSLAKKYKVAVPRTLELTRQLADTPELMTPGNRVLFLSRLANLEKE